MKHHWYIKDFEALHTTFSQCLHCEKPSRNKSEQGQQTAQFASSLLGPGGGEDEEEAQALGTGSISRKINEPELPVYLVH